MKKFDPEKVIQRILKKTPKKKKKDEEEFEIEDEDEEIEEYEHNEKSQVEKLAGLPKSKIPLKEKMKWLR